MSTTMSALECVPWNQLDRLVHTVTPTDIPSQSWAATTTAATLTLSGPSGATLTSPSLTKYHYCHHPWAEPDSPALPAQ